MAAAGGAQPRPFGRAWAAVPCRAGCGCGRHETKPSFPNRRPLVFGVRCWGLVVVGPCSGLETEKLPLLCFFIVFVPGSACHWDLGPRLCEGGELCCHDGESEKDKILQTSRWITR